MWHRKREKDFTKENVEENYGKVREVKKTVLPFQKIELLEINKKASQEQLTLIPVYKGGLDFLRFFGFKPLSNRLRP